MISLQHVTKTMADKLLFEDISFKIGDHQKVGLVGPNGAGKTTLLNIILGKEQIDEGEVVVAHETIGYLPQKLVCGPTETVNEYLTSFLTEDWESYKIDEVLAKVSLQGLDQDTVIAKLSGGQKMKIAMSGVLLTEPTALLLDEPTNNLDVKSIIWLENFVKSFDGKVFLISHDRYFLDACVNKIIELSPFTRKIEEYGGNYTSYKEQKALRYDNQMVDFKLQQKREKHMKEWIAEKRQQLQWHPSAKVASQLQAMKTRFEREIVNNRLDKPKLYTSFNINSIGDQLHESKTVIGLQKFKIENLLYAKELYVYGQDRINLQGRNGSGKTTLIKSILGHAHIHSGDIEIGPDIKFGYFSQEHELLDFEDIVLRVFMSQTKTENETDARGILGRFLFSKHKVFARVGNLSEGEKARLLIAIIIYQKNDFLFLDEPTNHLDLESREVLAEALQEYEGGFLVISHDRYFLQQIGIERTFVIEKGMIEEKKEE